MRAFLIFERASLFLSKRFLVCRSARMAEYVFGIFPLLLNKSSVKYNSARFLLQHMRSFFQKGQSLLGRRQGSILSAAFVILALIALSRILGLIRYRVFAHFFPSEELSIYLAALRVPETLFEVLVAGSLASAFIPVFTSLFSKGDKRRAWYVAGITNATMFALFAIFAVIVFIFAGSLTEALTPGFSASEQALMTSLTRFLLVVQGFFLLSFFMSAVQESFQRFLVPAIAPLFYNLGMIFGAAFLPGMGVWGIAIGAAVGSLLQFLIQVPFAYQLGFAFLPKINFKDPDFRHIVRLAMPRIVEVSVLQVSKSVELFLATTISVASYTHFIFASSLHLFPVALFGYSFGKASFPTLSYHAARGNKEEFANILTFTLGQILFFIVPVAVVLSVLRIPLVRIAFGAQYFDWEATVQTGFALSAFMVAIVAQGINGVLVRSLYAFQDTKTPVVIAVVTTAMSIALYFVFIAGLKTGVWGLAAAYSISSFIQTVVLIFVVNRRIVFLETKFLANVGKIVFSATVSGFVMYFLLKILDQAVWDRRLEFLGSIGLALPTTFQLFVLDTRYTINLLFLTALVVTIGILTYVIVAAVFRCREVELLARWIGKIAEREVPLPVTGTVGVKSELPAPLPPGG